MSLVSEYHQIDWLRWKGTSGGHLVQHPAQAGLSRAKLSRTTSRLIFNVSKVEDLLLAEVLVITSIITALQMSTQAA